MQNVEIEMNRKGEEISKQVLEEQRLWCYWGRRASPVLLLAGTWYSLWSRSWTGCFWSRAVAGWWCEAAWGWLQVTWAGCGPRLSSSPGTSSWGSVGFQRSLRTTSSWVGFLEWWPWNQECAEWSGRCEPNVSAPILLLVGRNEKRMTVVTKKKGEEYRIGVIWGFLFF